MHCMLLYKESFGIEGERGRIRRGVRKRRREGREKRTTHPGQEHYKMSINHTRQEGSPEKGKERAGVA